MNGSSALRVLLCFPLLISICLVSPIRSAPAANSTTAPASDPAGGDANILGAIIKAVEGLPESHFSGDQELVQKADRVNGLTTYRHREGEKGGKAVFFRRKSDSGKKVVVLGNEQLKHSAVKRTYIVLRQTAADPKIYTVFYAYVRDAKATDVSAVTIGSKKRLIEFDTWDARGSSRNLQRSLGWTTCSESVYPPCKNKLVDTVQVEKSDPVESEYSVEEDTPPKETNKSRIMETKMKSGDGVNVPSYYDFFADLDETAAGVAYIVKTVGTYTFSLSAATAASPPETLLLAGIRPTDPAPAKAAEMAAMKTEDMKRAMVLFKTLNNDTTPLAVDSIPVVTVGTSATGRSVGKVDMERFQRLKDQYDSVIEKLQALSKVYPIQGAKEEPEDPSLQVKGTESPNQQLNLYKSQSLKLLAKISEKGLPVLEGILEQSEVGQELTDNPEEGQDLLNEQDPQVLLEAEEEYATAPPPSEGDLDEEQLLQNKSKVKAKLLEKVRKAKKEQRSLKKVTSKIKAKSEALKNEAPRKGGLLSGAILKILIDYQNGRSVSPAATGRGMLDDPLAAMMGGMMGGDSGGGGGILGALMGSAGGSDLISSLIGPVMNALGSDGQLSYFKLVTGVGDALVQKAANKIPIIGGPLASLAGLFHSGVTGVGSILGLGRSIGSGTDSSEESSSNTNLFGHIGWRSSEINSEELGAASGKAEEGAPFTGFGNCPKKPATLADFQSSKTVDDIVSLLTTVLRTQCSDVQKKQISKLFTSDILKLNEDKTVSINPLSPLLKSQKLSKSEDGDLSAAFELSSFSQALISEWKKPSPAQNPDGSNISPTVHTFIKAALLGLDEARKALPLHFIKLARNAGISLKTGFTKLLQDYDRYKACSKCIGGIMEMAKNDLLGITGMTQFVIAGLGPVDQGTKDATTAYKAFFLLNKAALEEKIKPFL